MTTPSPYHKDSKRGGLRLVMLILGFILIIVAPLVGAIPGPGGVFVFAAGMALVLKNSMWAKKLYARLKRKHPNKGEWVDWSLRRRSALRRARRAKRRARRLKAKSNAD